MQRLTKNGEVLTDDWQVLAKDAPQDPTQVDAGRWLVHAKWYLAQVDSLEARTDLGLWLDSDDDIESVAGILGRFSVIGVNFPVFTDGRGFSLGRSLREQCGFNGELRAIGNFMQDQLFYLKRCGFDAFIINDGVDANAMAKSLRDFSNFYQAAVDEPLPLFRRRALQH